MASATSKYEIIPSGYKPVILPGGNVALEKKKRSRRRYKLSKATRQKMSTAAKKFKVPVLTVGANVVPAIATVGAIKEIIDNPITPAAKAVHVYNNSLAFYTGVELDIASPRDPASKITPKFNFGKLAVGLGPNLIVYLLKKSGVFRGANQALAKSKLPIRLS